MFKTMEKEKISQNAAIDAVKSNARFFEIEITLRLFGVVVAHWFFPPKK